jgi:hypothetical protein
MRSLSVTVVNVPSSGRMVANPEVIPFLRQIWVIEAWPVNRSV